MGGWRCSYRNCTMRSDGKTHMFHYPVFDKVRCHQWLVNAGRLDFLNLKVSQLKNRVVCQHHFSDEQFMNFKRDKLTFNAVPYIDGPYCNVSEGENENLKETSNSLSIIFDDIENEYMTLLDKKANYSVKYADFLTSNELDGIDISSIVPQQSKPSEFVLPSNEGNDSKAFIKPDMYERQENISVCDSLIPDVKSNQGKYSKTNSKPTTCDINKKYQTQPVLLVPPYKSKSIQNENQSEENILEIELPPGFMNNNTLLRDNKEYKVEQRSGNMYGINDQLNANNVDSNYINIDNKPSDPLIAKPAKNKAKIKILSEQRISEPLTVIGNLEPLSPSTILPIQTQRKKDGIKESECKINQDSKSKSPRASLLKKKITPERIAAIEEKRKFNMKLRDIIESFFGKLDEQEKEIKDAKEVNTHNQIKQIELNNISNIAKSPNPEESVIASLEARIKKMENKLLHKIDENSQKIVELKNTIEQTKQLNKSNATQTSSDDECQKKRLYQEISKYLSPDANSLIYEELFINKYAKSIAKVPSKRKRTR